MFCLPHVPQELLTVFAELLAQLAIWKLLTLTGTGNNANNILPLSHSYYAF